MHLAGLAVEAQGERFITMLQHQWVGAYGALHASNALGLFRAQAQAEAHAVLRDHQADFAQLLVAFIGGLHHLDAVLGVERGSFAVVDVRQISEGVFRVDSRRFRRLGTG